MKRTLILGGPGTGKTHSLLQIMEGALARGIPPGELAFVSFTNAAVDEAREKACKRFGLTAREFPYFRTIHSLAFRELALRKDDVVDETHLAELAEITGELFTGEPTEGPAAGRNADPLLTLDHYARATRQTLRAAWDAHGGEVDWFRLKRFSDAYKAFKEDRGLVDFSDMLERYAMSDLPPTPVRVAIVDESQDSTLLQRACTDKAFARAEELWEAGDADQCQPGDTLVTLEGRKTKRLADLDPRTDRVLTYARSDAMIYGYRRGFAIKKSRRNYTGGLYTITVGDKKTSCTDNHKWLVRWRPEAKHEPWFVVYLMKQDHNWRVGWCQLFVAHTMLHLNHRANKERADAAWILKTFKNKRDAYCYEQIVNARYGIPMAPFNPTGTIQTRAEVVKKIFAAVDSETGALRALADHHRMLDHPFVNRKKQNYTRYGAAINSVVACNLFDELMLMPIDTGTKSLTWKPFTLTMRRVSKMRVYNLDVEKHHTYIADGIITHNSIHHWAGAAGDAFRALPYEREILPLSHRLPASVFALSQNIIKRVADRIQMDTRPSARQGSVEWVADPEEVDLGAGKWLLLARTRAQLPRLASIARGQGVVYAVKGEPSVDPKHVAAILAYERLRSGKRVEGAEASAALRAAGLRRDIPEDETVTAAELEIDVGPIWHDALIRIPLADREYYLACRRRGENLLEPRVRIDTIHGSKGTEAENVLLVTDMTYRVQRGYELEPSAEVRVFYVGITRASERLVLVVPQTAYGFAI
jgi:hypothetical protein